MIKKLLLLLVIGVLFGCNDSEEKEKIEMEIDFKVNNPVLQESMERGMIVYNDFCIRCHNQNDKIAAARYPPLVGSDWLTDKRRESIHAVKYGLRGKIVVNGKEYNDIMIPMNLSDQEVADVLNYVMNSWGNKQEKMVTVEEVKTVPKKMPR